MLYGAVVFIGRKFQCFDEKRSAIGLMGLPTHISHQEIIFNLKFLYGKNRLIMENNLRAFLRFMGLQFSLDGRSSALMRKEAQSGS
jgi:hypothetical protein